MITTWVQVKLLKNLNLQFKTIFLEEHNLIVKHGVIIKNKLS